MAPAVRVAVLADTHLHAGKQRQRELPPAAWDRIAASDVILHAGDVVDAGTLERLEAAAPTYAVLGNNDVGLQGRLPAHLLVELAGVRLALIHDSGARKGRAGRMRRRFPSADVVVFGHSHIPLNEVGLDGQVLFNPGSPTARRAQPACTMGELLLAGGRCVERQIIGLGP